MNDQPTTCHCCQRHAVGIGVGPASKPQWLCHECVQIVGHVARAKRMDPYELKALDGGVDAVGEYLSGIGKTDLADMDELEARLLVKAAWQGCGDRLRELLVEGEAPF